VISLEYAVHNLPTALFGALKYNDAVVVDGQSYTVREPMVTGDGRYMMVALSKVEISLNTVFVAGVFEAGVFD
jgi:hypothetical protein